MIDFDCPQCHGHFSVADNLAGRRARCKKCATPLTIPSPAQQAAIEAALVEPAKREPRPAAAASAASKPTPTRCGTPLRISR